MYTSLFSSNFVNFYYYFCITTTPNIVVCGLKIGLLRRGRRIGKKGNPDGTTAYKSAGYGSRLHSTLSPLNDILCGWSALHCHVLLDILHLFLLSLDLCVAAWICWTSKFVGLRKSPISLCPVPKLFHMPCFPYGTILRSIDTANRKGIILPVSPVLPACTLIDCASTPIVSSTELRWPNQPSSMFTNTDRSFTTRQDIFSRFKRSRFT